MKRQIIPAVRVLQSMCLLRGQRVMLCQDLASLYGVTVSALTQAVKRNANRFLNDFAFRLTAEELTNLKSQFVISSVRETASRYGTRKRRILISG